MLPCSLSAFSFPNGITLFLQIDDLTSRLETTSSKCLHLGRKNQVLQQELLLMKTIQKKCVKLEKNKRKLEQEVESLRSHMEKNMVEHSQVQQYRREVEEQARQDLVEKLKQVNLFLQVCFCDARSSSHCRCALAVCIVCVCSALFPRVLERRGLVCPVFECSSLL